MTHFGVAANIIVAPLISLLIMPMALLSLLAMPLGLETWPLQLMGIGNGAHDSDGGVGRFLARGYYDSS